jgi:hypothetical protein
MISLPRMEQCGSEFLIIFVNQIAARMANPNSVRD